MKVGDIVKFVHPPGLGVTMNAAGWAQQSPGLNVDNREAGHNQGTTYEVLWKNGETTFEWHSYLEVISEA